jgi:hypothetical protein
VKLGPGDNVKLCDASFIAPDDAKTERAIQARRPLFKTGYDSAPLE